MTRLTTTEAEELKTNNVFNKANDAIDSMLQINIGASQQQNQRAQQEEDHHQLNMLFGKRL